MSKAAERIQRAVEIVRKYMDTPQRELAVEHLREVVEAVRVEHERERP